MAAELFNKRYVFSASVSNEQTSVDNVRVEVELSEVGKPSMKGAFFGNSEMYERLKQVVFSQHLKFDGTWCSDQSSYNIRFTGKDIFWTSFHTPEEDEKLCDFECAELESSFERKVTPEKLTSIRIHFALPQRHILEKPFIAKEWKDDPDLKTYFEFDTELGKMEIQWNNHAKDYAVADMLGKFSYKEPIFMFNKIPLTTEGDEVIEDAKNIVADYLDVVSLIGGCRTDWYRMVINYFDGAGSCPRWYVKLINIADREERSWMKRRNWRASDKLLKMITPIYSTHYEKPTIREALVMYSAGMHAENPEAQLIWCQSAIEIIVNTLWRIRDLPVDTCIACGEETSKLKDRLRRICLELKVRLDDIYPSVLKESSGRTFPFIKYRNRIVHGRLAEVPLVDLVEEIDRQQFLLERLLIHWIGIDSKRIYYLENLPYGVKPY